MSRIERAAHGEIAGLRERLSHVALQADGHLLPFGADARLRLLERQRTSALAAERRAEIARLETRARIAAMFRDTVGERVSLAQMKLDTWEDTLLHGILEKSDGDSPDWVLDHMEWITQVGVARPYVAHITQPRYGSTALSLLGEAMEIREGVDPVQLMERHVTWAILDVLIADAMLEDGDILDMDDENPDTRSGA